MFSKFICFVTFLVAVSEAADILAISPFPSYSHQIAYMEFWRELSLRGHKVTLITTDPLKDPTLTNLTEIDVKWSYELYSDIGKMAENILNMWNVYDVLLNILGQVSDAQLSYPPVQDLIHNRTRFDIVFVEFIFPEFLAFAEIYNCPKILYSTMDSNEYYHKIMGNPSHPILNPDLAASFHGPLNFFDRVVSTLHSLHLWLYYHYKFVPSMENRARKYFNVALDLRKVINDVDMLFVNVNPVIQSPRAVGPSTINVGGYRKTISPKSLPLDLKKFLDDAKSGFIYFSLGGNVKSKQLNKETLKAIVDTLRELPHKVLWKFEADELAGKPDNVKLIKWAPQQEILSHPNIKLFITQGGLQSTEEAIYNAVPLVVIPFFGDQQKNAHLMEAKGIAKVIERTPYVKKIDLKNAILEVITNPSYKNSVKRLKQLALDTPMTGLERAIWWTEYVIRNKGAKHLRNPAADLPIYEYYLIDVMSFLVLLTVSILLVLSFLTKKLIRTILFKLKHKQKLQ